MKNIFYILLLLPTIIFAQYPSNSGQKITLGEQTTADGLVFRGRASIDTLTATNKITRANKQDTSAFLLLDTTTNLLWHYKTGSNGWIQAGGSTFDTTTLNLVSRFALKLNISDTASMLTPYWRSGRFSGVLPVANGGTNASTFTEGSVVFAGASGTYTQDNSGLFYDNTNDRLGIGTASPSDKLTVSGSIRLTSTLFANTQTNNTVLSSSDATNIANGFNLLGSSSYWGIRTLASGDLSLDVFNSFNPKSALYIANNGNVGIGTASPGYRLEVVGTDGTAGATSTVLRLLGNIGGVNKSGGLFFRTLNSTTTGTERIAIIQSADVDNNTRILALNPTGGDVGIGTASPVAKFEVNGALSAYSTSAVTGILRVTNITDSGAAEMGITAGGVGFWIQSKDKNTFSATYPLLLQPQGNNVGIGTTSPGYSLEVKGGINSSSPYRAVIAAFKTASYDQYLSITGDGSGTAGGMGIQYGVGTGVPEIFLTSGKVGIGTTSPNFKTHISTGSNTSITQPTAGTYGLYIQQNTSGNVGGLYIQDGASNSGNSIYVGDNNGAARFVVNTDGNVGIGTMSPVELFQVTGGRLYVNGTTTSSGITWNNFNIYQDASTNLIYRNGTAEIFRFASTGAATFSSSVFVSSQFQARNTTSADPTISCWNGGISGDNKLIEFYTEAGGNTRGNITYNRAAGLVSYNTTSDRRAKTILGEVASSNTTIYGIKVYDAIMKDAIVSRPMFIADELELIAPYAVTGKKDAVDKEGKPIYQQVDVSSLIPIMIKAIQELKAEIDILKQEIINLKNK